MHLPPFLYATYFFFLIIHIRHYVLKIFNNCTILIDNKLRVITSQQFVKLVQEETTTIIILLCLFFVFIISSLMIDPKDQCLPKVGSKQPVSLRLLMTCHSLIGYFRDCFLPRDIPGADQEETRCEKSLKQKIDFDAISLGIYMLKKTSLVILGCYYYNYLIHIFAIR